jgi:A/G-specific adenine glycosylase
MPWKGEKDPYKIWLSEIILQQTRVEQGLKFYENFLKAFPDIHALAKAPQEKVFKQWEGLGYYSRCRNLIHTARAISGTNNGLFPSTYETILQLKGVGSYTAAAISSFAFNLPHAVLDGNVYRVLSRIFGIATPVDSTKGKKEFFSLAHRILPKKKAAEYNQSIMDFGAVICKPVPLCSSCFFNTNCTAYLNGQQLLLPVKEKKIAIKKRWLNYVILKFNDEIAIQQRKDKDIWQDLFQFLLIETSKNSTKRGIRKALKEKFGLREMQLCRTERIEQRLSHQSICFSFTILELNERVELENFQWVNSSKLHQFPFPRTLQQYIQRLF